MITYQVIAYGLAAILVSILGWGATTLYTRLVQISAELTDVRTRLTEMQVKMLSRMEIRQMVADEVRKQLIGTEMEDGK